MAGIAVASTGYGHPQGRRGGAGGGGQVPAHLRRPISTTRAWPALCERLAKLAPGPTQEARLPDQLRDRGGRGGDQAGAHATGRTAIVAFSGAFHGRTYGAVSPDVEQGAPARRASGRCCPRCITCPTPTATAATTAPTRPRAPWAASANIEQDLFARHLDPHDVAAIFVEPVQGEGGYVVPPDGLPARRCARCATATASCSCSTRCSRGVGRTGKMFACEHDGVEPDILLTAKGLGSGMPIGAIIARESVDQVGDRRARLDLRRQPGLLRRGAGDARRGRAASSWPTRSAHGRRPAGRCARA